MSQCHNGKIEGPWGTILDGIKVYLLSAGFEMGSENPDIPFFKTKTKNDGAGLNFFIIPLKPEILPCLKKWRADEGEYKAPVIFLTEYDSSDSREYRRGSYPRRKNPDMDPREKQVFFGNPEYKDIFQAILRGEFIEVFENDYNDTLIKNSRPKKKGDRDGGSSNGHCVFSNIVPVFSEKFPENLIENCINQLSKKDIQSVWEQMGRLRKAFYEAFVNYYDYSTNKVLTRIFNNKSEKKFERINSIGDVNQCIDDFDVVYKALTTEQGEKDITHRKDKDFIKSPVSFPLCDFAQKLISLKSWIQGNAKDRVHFLLIDNRTEKFIEKKNEPGRLCKLLLDDRHGLPEELRSAFQISMLEQEPFELIEGKIKIPDSNHNEQNLELDSHLFFEEENEDYRKKIYKKIKEAHFILLDFFLDKDDIWLAFDFIQEINKLKNEENENFITWFFITSAVHDSVSKYQQSGLLAEFYETAIVNSGDDCLNAKRTIIFLYKLITFMYSRYVNFIMYQKEIEELWSRCEDKKCTEDACLQQKRSCITRYLTEFDSLSSILFSEKASADSYRKVIERVQDTINKFLNLPQADWRMVQYQIDYIDANLKKYDQKHQFCCHYIIKSIESSAEIF